MTYCSLSALQKGNSFGQSVEFMPSSIDDHPKLSREKQAEVAPRFSQLALDRSEDSSLSGYYMDLRAPVGQGTCMWKWWIQATKGRGAPSCLPWMATLCTLSTVKAPNISPRQDSMKEVGLVPSALSGIPVIRMLYLLDLPPRSSIFRFSCSFSFIRLPIVDSSVVMA